MKEKTKTDALHELRRLMDTYPELQLLRISRGTNERTHYLITVETTGRGEHRTENFMEPKHVYGLRKSGRTGAVKF